MTEEVNERIPSSTPNSRKMTIYLSILTGTAIGMFVFAYVNAEFFVMVCQNIGLLAKDPNAARGIIQDEEGGREIDVYFSAAVNDNLPIAFSVEQSYQSGNLGKAEINDYHFRNLSNRTIYFRPVHDISPDEAGDEGVLILEKCFCFTEQKIDPGQKYSLPVKYTFTKELPDRVHAIKMNYTLFRSSKDQYEASITAFENGQTPDGDSGG